MKLPESYYHLYFKEAAGYLEQLEKLTASLPGEIDEPLLEQARRSAHTLKGDSLTMQMQVIAETAAELEQLFAHALTTGAAVEMESAARKIQMLGEQIEEERSSRGL